MLILAATSALLSLVAPVEPSHAQGQSSQSGPVIGVAVPLSGDYKSLGQQVLTAVELAASESAVGVVTADTEGTPIGAMKAVETLAANDRVMSIVGPLGRRESQAAAGAAQRAKIPMITLSSAELINQSGPWVFRARRSPGEVAGEFARFAHSSLGAETVGILFPDNRYGHSAATAFARAFEEKGGRVTAVSAYSEDVTDFRKPLGALVGTRVFLGPRARYGVKRADSDGFARISSKTTVDFDALFVPDYHGRVARLLPFLPMADIQTGEGGDGEPVQLLGMPGWQGESMRMTGAHAAGAIYPDVFAGPAAGGKAGSFARMFESTTGRRPVDLDAQAFDVAWIVASSIEDVWSKSQVVEVDKRTGVLRRQMLDALPREQSRSGASGPIRFGPNGEPKRPLELYEFDVDGEVAPWNGTPVRRER